MVGCRLVVRFRLFACLLYARKKVKFFLKLESNSLAVHDTLEPGANKRIRWHTNNYISSVFVDFILTCI